MFLVLLSVSSWDCEAATRVPLQARFLSFYHSVFLLSSVFLFIRHHPLWLLEPEIQENTLVPVCVCPHTVCAHVRQSARLGHNKRHLQISHMGKTITDPTHTRPRAAEPLFTPDAGGLCVPQTQMGPWTPRTGLRPGVFLAVGPGRSALIVVVQVRLTGWIWTHSSFCLSVTAQKNSHAYEV